MEDLIGTFELDLNFITVSFLDLRAVVAGVSALLGGAISDSVLASLSGLDSEMRSFEMLGCELGGVAEIRVELFKSFIKVDSLPKSSIDLLVSPFSEASTELSKRS